MQALAGSHWESRTYFTELMTGRSFGSLWISAVTLAALEDSRWDAPDDGLAESLAWGDQKAAVGATAEAFRRFPIGAPAHEWLMHYVAHTNSMQCGGHSTTSRRAPWRRRGEAAADGRRDEECDKPRAAFPCRRR
jgi:hypothetical protein